MSSPPAADLPRADEPPRGAGRVAWAVILTGSAAWLLWLRQGQAFLSRVGENWPLGVLSIALLMIIAGRLGRGVGLPELFRFDHDSPRPWARPLSAGFGAVLLLTACWIPVYYMERLEYPEHIQQADLPLALDEGWFPTTDNGEMGPRAFLLVNLPPVLLMLLAVVAFPVSGRDPDLSRRRLREDAAAVHREQNKLALREAGIYLLAAAVTFALAVGLSWAGEELFDGIKGASLGWFDRFFHKGPGGEPDANGNVPSSAPVILCSLVALAAGLAVAAVVVFVPAVRRLLSPGLGLGFILTALVGLYFSIVILRDGYQPVWAVLLLVLIAASNVPVFRFRFPNLGHCDKPIDLTGPLPAFDPGLLDEAEVLHNWRERHKQKPHLVLLAVSGAAYRSAFWVGTVLDRLAGDGRLKDVPGHIRLITGASGGMVGAAYHVALRAAGRPDRVVDAMWADTSGDTLTPVVRQLVRRDLPLLFWPGVRHQVPDRGIVLEEHWAGLDRSVRSLAEHERSADIPSLLFTPTAVPLGRPLIISNLDLSYMADAPAGGGFLDRRALEFFKLFRDSGDFNLRTAVRMNATFPYLSPAVRVPTRPSQHVVDAGFFDNYGVSFAAAWLTRHRQWLIDHTEAVTLIQLRAFSLPKELTAAGAESGQFGFLTAPVRAALSVRSSRMEAQNAELLRLAVEPLQAAADQPETRFRGFRLFEFAYPGTTAMNWFLRKRALEDMRWALGEGDNAQAWSDLGDWWDAP